MRVPLRVAAFSLAALLLGPGASLAGPINVAEFRWTSSLNDPGTECDPLDAACVPGPSFLSIFQLTNLWDGRDPATLTGNRLTLPDGDLPWFDLDPPFAVEGINFDQLAVIGALPAFAVASVSFVFDGQPMSLSARLDAAETSAVLRFDAPDPAPVPEPGTLTLVAIGLAASVARLRRKPAIRF